MKWMTRLFGSREGDRSKRSAAANCVQCEYLGEWEDRSGEVCMRCGAPHSPRTDHISMAEASAGFPCDAYKPMHIGRRTMIYRDSVVMAKAIKGVQYLTPGVQIKETFRNTQGHFYEVYKSASRDTALRFLRAIPDARIPPFYYVVVETPAGNVGKDSDGIYDESTQESIE